MHKRTHGKADVQTRVARSPHQFSKNVRKLKWRRRLFLFIFTPRLTCMAQMSAEKRSCVKVLYTSYCHMGEICPSSYVNDFTIFVYLL